MSHALRISEDATLALHAMAVVAARAEGPVALADIATELRVPEPDLQPVVARLRAAGLVTAGAAGPVALGRDAAQISLLEIYEALDGPLGCNDCLMGEPTCHGEACMLGDLIKSVNEQMRSYLGNTRLADVAGAYRAQATGRGA